MNKEEFYKEFELKMFRTNGLFELEIAVPNSAYDLVWKALKSKLNVDFMNKVSDDFDLEFEGGLICKFKRKSGETK